MVHIPVHVLPSGMRSRTRFTGRVQGVGFRATTRSIALRHRATGWVRNEPDGSVLAEVQGSPPQVEGVLAAIREAFQGLLHGEDRSTVSDDPEERSFEIRP